MLPNKYNYIYIIIKKIDINLKKNIILIKKILKKNKEISEKINKLKNSYSLREKMFVLTGKRGIQGNYWKTHYQNLLEIEKEIKKKNFF